MADAAQRALAPGLPTEAEKAKLFKGTGVLVKGQQPGGGVPPAPAAQAAPGGSVVLNFEGADIREVIRSILGDILNVNYSIEGTVGGTVTLRTSTGIPREALPATLEMLLRANGAAMIKEEGIYKILPAANVVRGNVTPQLGNSQRALPPGFSVQIVPLRYIGVREMMRILEPFAKDAAAARPDDLRNLIIISGTENELRHLMETIAMFDVNWMEGMSVGLFTLQNADVKIVGQELEKVIGDKATSPLTGILRIIPIERLNALLVITPQPAYLDEAKKWIARLDAGGGGDGPRLFVYSMQSQRAEKLGPLLTQAFTGRVQQQAATPAPTLAPGTTQGTIVSPPGFVAQSTQPGLQPIQVQTTNMNQQPATGAAGTGGAAGTARGTAAAGAGGEGLGIIRNIQVVADKDNNQLLIVATPPEYAVIETALKKLDVPSRQVAIEVTIASVSLTDDLKFGVEWLFKGGAPSGRGSGGNVTISTPSNPAVPLAAAAATAAVNPALALAQGFYYIINNSNFPRRRAGGAAPARPVRRHQGAREPAPRRARQPEGDDQGRHADPDQPAEHRGRRVERRHHGRVLHRHRRAAAGHAAHQCRRARGARGRRRGERPRRDDDARRGAAHQHALGADQRQRPVRADDGDGRPDPGDARATRRTVCRSCRASRYWAASSVRRSSPTTATSSSSSSRPAWSTASSTFAGSSTTCATGWKRSTTTSTSSSAPPRRPSLLGPVVSPTPPPSQNVPVSQFGPPPQKQPATDGK